MMEVMMSYITQLIWAKLQSLTFSIGKKGEEKIASGGVFKRILLRPDIMSQGVDGKDAMPDDDSCHKPAIQQSSPKIIPEQPRKQNRYSESTNQSKWNKETVLELDDYTR